MTQKAIIRLGVMCDGDRTVAVSRHGLYLLIEAILHECETIESDIAQSMCIKEKSRLMRDYLPLVDAHASLTTMADALKA